MVFLILEVFHLLLLFWHVYNELSCTDLVELEKLYLDRTELTDEGVEHLVGTQLYSNLLYNFTYTINRSFKAQYAIVEPYCCY